MLLRQNLLMMGQTSVAPLPESVTSSSPASITRWVRYLPIALVMVYLNLTVALFAWGPWRYPIADGLRVYGFLLLAHLALVAGYLTTRPDSRTLNFGDRAAVGLVKLSLGVTLLLLVPTSFLDTGSVIPNVIAGLTDPGAAYARSLEWRNARTLLTSVAYVRILAGPLLFLLFPLLIVYWSLLSIRVRALGVLALAVIAAIYIAMGVNKGIADLLGLFPALALAAYFARKLNLTRGGWMRVGVAWGIAVLLFLRFFAGTQMTRTGSASEYGYLPAGVAQTTRPQPSETSTPSPITASPTASPTPSAIPTFRGGVAGIPVDYDHPLVRSIGSGPLRTGIVGLSFYVTHGYYALYLSLDKPFVPMFGVGNSIFFTQQAVRITGNEEIGKLSYPKRIEEDGWDALGLWSSIYPWIASDVSFPGTILVVFLIGRLFALAWFDALSGRNPFAYGMLAQFVIMLLYFPANNQTLQFGEGFMAFWAILVLWLATRNRSVPLIASRLSRLASTRTTPPGPTRVGR
jgi:hypothetical protein